MDYEAPLGSYCAQKEDLQTMVDLVLKLLNICMISDEPASGGARTLVIDCTPKRSCSKI